MITRKEYDRIPDRDWRGVKARTLRDLRNGYVRVRKGSVVTITRKFSGFEIERTPCRRCGVAVHINRVPHDALERIGG